MSFCSTNQLANKCLSYTWWHSKVPAIKLFGIALLVAVHGMGGAVGTFINAPQRIDMVYDDARHVLYITNGSQVLRYSLPTQRFLSPITLGGSLKGIDISLDGNTLAVADATAVAGSAHAHIIDLNTSATSKATYPLESSYAEGPGSVAFCSDGKLLISTGAQWGKLHRYDPATRLVTDIGGLFRHRSMLCASADGSIVGFAEGDISDGRFGRYRTSDGNLLLKQLYEDGTSWFNYEIGVNRNGTQSAIPTYGGTFIYNENLVKTGTIIGTYAGPQPIGVVYSPVADVVYFPWAGSSFIYAYDTNTYQIIAQYDVEHTFVNNGNQAYREGRLKMSGDGKLLFCTVAGGVRFIKFSTPPVADPQSITVDEDTAVSITLTAMDNEDDPISYSIQTPPTFGALSGDLPNLTYTPNPDYAGPDSFLFTASDGNEVSSHTLVSINVVDIPDAPLAEEQSVTTLEDTPLNVTIYASDAEGDPLTYRVTVQPTNGALSGIAPDLVYTPTDNFIGIDTFEFVANDGTQDSEPARVQISVINEADRPIANNQEITVSEDSAITIVLSGTDPDHDPLAYTVTAEPQHGSLLGTAPDLYYYPTPDYSGTDSFTFRVNDGAVDSLDATVSITIEGVPDAPVANTMFLTTREESPQTLILSASDAEGDPLTYRVTSQPSHGTVLGTTAYLVYWPADNFKGKDIFEFVANDGHQDSQPARVIIDVTNVADRPVAQANAVTTLENSPASIALTGTDPDGDPLAYFVSSMPQFGTITGTAPNLIYTPNRNYTGTDSIAFYVNDGSANSLPATVSITVLDGPVISNAPVAEEQSIETPQDTPVQVKLQATDADGDALSYQVTGAPTHGTITGVAPNLTYTSNAGYHGTDSFTFVASDGSRLSQPAVISILVNESKDAPVVETIKLAVIQNKPVSFTLAAPGNSPTGLSYLLKSLPQHGTISGTLPNLTYTPDKKFKGADSFEFEVANGTQSVVGKVEIMVMKKNKGVVAYDQSLVLQSGSVIPITLTGWSVTGTDLIYQVTKHPKKGTLTGSAPNFIYSSHDGSSGTDVIKFKVSSSGKKSKTAKIRILVGGK